MEGQDFDKSVIAFSRPAPDGSRIILGASAMVLILIATGMAAGSGQWPIAGILAISFLAAGSYLWIGFRDARRAPQPRLPNNLGLRPAIPEVQRQNLNVEVGELCRRLEVDSGQLSEMQSAYIVAEDLALRHIQFEENAALIRHVSIARVPFDAVLLKGDCLICCDVAFLVTPDLRQEKIDAMIRKASAVRKTVEESVPSFETRLMAILITQLSQDEADQLRHELSTRRFSKIPVDIDIRLLEFETLQGIYIAP